MRSYTQNLNDIPEWIAVDWGTSNVRAWAIDRNGVVLAQRESAKGMNSLKSCDYSRALGDLLHDVGTAIDDPIEVVICGMAGARQGWREAPYLEAPHDLNSLMLGAVRPETDDTRFAPVILPGLCQRANSHDVMRGEETQLLGLSRMRPGHAGIVCMPGTHSKWAMLDGAIVEQFWTSMTGEVYELMRTHSVLRHSLSGNVEGPGREDGFATGARLGIDRPKDLLSTLFQVRAQSLLSYSQPDWCEGFLSGLLIGAEIGGVRHLIGHDSIPLIGSAKLCALYGRVLDLIGAVGEPLDATQITLAGLSAAREDRGQDN